MGQGAHLDVNHYNEVIRRNSRAQPIRPSLGDGQHSTNMMIYILTVCQNAKSKLAATIESVNSFRTEDLYFLVIDGDSTDGTKELLAKSGKRVDQWISAPDTGIYDAMNKGISLLPMKEGHVLVLGAGDLLLSLPSIEKTQSNTVLYGNVQVGDSLFTSKVGWKLRAGNTLHHQGLFIPRALLANLSYNPRYRIYADFDLNQRIYRSKIPFRALKTTIAFAEPGGVSWGASQLEMATIACANFGVFWGWVARLWIAYRLRVGKHRGPGYF